MSLRTALFVIRDIQVLQRTLIHRRFQSSRKSSNQYKLTTKLCTRSSSTVMGVWVLTEKKGDNETVITTKEVLIAKADALYEQEQYQEIHNLLIDYKVITLCVSLINVDNEAELLYNKLELKG